MGIFNKIFKSKTDISEQTYKHNIYSEEISQYSPLPRFYFIKGQMYDIDSPSSVANIPVCETHFNINEEDWGIDTILREHVNRYYSHIPESLKESCYPKISEIEWAGLKKESNAEKNARLCQEKKKLEEQLKLKTISLSDMEQLHFSNYKMSTPIYDNNMSIMTIIPENQNQVINDVQMINSCIQEACQMIQITDNLYIDPQKLKFDTKFDTIHLITQYYTYFECAPYTKTGKISKYPLILHYATNTHHTINPPTDFFGTMHYMQDGNIGKVRAIYWVEHTMYLFELGLIGKTLSVKKIEKSFNNNKNILYKV